LHLIEADGRCFLIGAGEGGLRLLARLDESERGGQRDGESVRAKEAGHG
jgi:hypothetical protein